MKRKNMIVFLLLAFALAIWGHNIYRVALGLKQTSDEYRSSSKDSAWARSDTVLTKAFTPRAFIYGADVRDPFASPLREHKPSRPANKPVPVRAQAPAPPDFRLRGIIHDDRGMLAVIESPEGEIHFAQARDVIAGVEVLTIAQERITCRFAKVQYEIALQ